MVSVEFVSGSYDYQLFYSGGRTSELVNPVNTITYRESYVR